MVRRRSIASSLISLGIVIFVALFVLIKKMNEKKGKKCYLDTVILNEEYNLAFEKWYDTRNGRPVVWCELTITNNTNTNLEVKLSNVIITDAKGTDHKCEAVTLNINPNEEDYYNFGYYYDSNTDTSKYKLHFKLNKDKYNVYFKNEPVKS